MAAAHRRRGLQMILRLLAHNAEHWLSDQLNAYLRDDDEYRAVTRETIIRGTAGAITLTPETATVTLQQPAEPRVARALAPLIDQVNTTPPGSRATPGPSPTSSPRTRRFNTSPAAPFGDLGLASAARYGLPRGTSADLRSA